MVGAGQHSAHNDPYPPSPYVPDEDRYRSLRSTRLNDYPRADYNLSPRGNRERSSPCRHVSYTEFTAQKMNLKTPIHSSPVRHPRGEDSYHGSHRPDGSHPGCFHQSQQQFTREKMRHDTPLHSLQPAGGDHNCHHSSHRAFAAEKAAHGTPVHQRSEHPESGGGSRWERRSHSCGHVSQRGFVVEKARHGTPIHQNHSPDGKHPDDSPGAGRHDHHCRHTSHRHLTFEKAGHHTPLHRRPSERRHEQEASAREASWSPRSSGCGHASLRSFNFEKSRHSTPIHVSPPRARPAHAPSHVGDHGPGTSRQPAYSAPRAEPGTRAAAPPMQELTRQLQELQEQTNRLMAAVAMGRTAPKA